LKQRRSAVELRHEINVATFQYVLLNTQQNQTTPYLSVM